MAIHHARRIKVLLTCFTITGLLAAVWAFSARDDPAGRRAAAPSPLRLRPPAVEIVMAKTKREDVSWVRRHLPEWPANIYSVDDAAAELTVPANKGNEAMAYLTYLITRYDSLPDTALFLHAERFQWHNDHPDYDSLWPLQNLNLSHVQAEGYINLRCAWVLGCPGEAMPFAMVAPHEQRDDGEEEKKKPVFEQAFEDLFPGVEVPDVVGVPCCSQFALSRETIRKRPREDYVRFRKWLLDTALEDKHSGRVFEYSWHIIFGKPAVHCPSAAHCYCKVYGLCDLMCSDRECDGRYILPPFSRLPQGWPRIGWEGEARNFTGPL